MKLYDAPHAPNPFTVRLFIAERGGLTLDVEAVDLAGLANREAAYRAVNPFGTVPALVLDDGTVLSDIVAVCEYLDEVANGGVTLVGSSPKERALTRMWTRRVDRDIAQRFVSWWRGGEDAVAFYRGHRIPETGGRDENRLTAERNLDALDARLGERGKAFILGDYPLLPDILLYAFLSAMTPAVPWLAAPGRANVAAWAARMEARPATAQARVPRDRIAA